ncbi:hypothetical protein CHS0354_032538 [Potamilus streckersoni]|uniref:ADP-ribosylation factor n=1 Tax=Potamilus streckersoni TaxID=2493646 RepID=A0AAE0SQ09_9BIVA|nr:hypothetical protein CHS0354_032538 [Potamilus streckersoni]
MGVTCSSKAAISVSTTKLILLGAKGSGKTRLLYSWLLGVSSLVDTISTESFNVEPVQTPDGINLLVWDISGDPSYRTKRRQFFHGTEGIVYIIDTSDPALMQEAKEDLVTILRDRDLLKVPLLLIANTRSSQGALDDYRLKKELNLKSVLRERRWDTVTIAAFDQKEVDTSLEKLQNLLKSTWVA